MKITMTAFFALLTLIFYGLKLTDHLQFLSTYQMAIGTLLALWSYHLSLKVFIDNHNYHVMIMLVTAGLLTLDKMYTQPGMPTLYMMIVTLLHGLALLAVLVSIPFSSLSDVAHAQRSTDGNDDDD